ncbi:glycosyltransferase, partial [Plectonema radiosum NIES-515]
PTADPYHYLHWLQTGKRHYPSYYDRLKKSAACAGFGGFFVPPWPKNPGNVINRVVKQVLIKLNLKTNRVVQWDSWRFWESLAAGCATFHVDFDKYGIGLPVMPENWRHYIGIDLDNVQEAVDRIANDPEIIERIATQGRLWALEHYSPGPTALRFLETIHQNEITDNLKQEKYLTVGK